MEDLKKRAAKGAVWSLIQNSSSEIIAAVVFLAMARLLAPRDFGLVAFCGVFITFMQTFLDQGLTGAIVQRHEIDPRHMDAALWGNFALSLLLAVILFFAAGWIATISHTPAVVEILPWLAVNLPLNSLIGVQQAIYARELKYKPLAIRVVVGNTAGGIIGVGMALSGFGVWSIVGQQIGTSLFGMVTLWSVSSWRPKFRFSMRHLIELSDYAVPVTSSAFLDFFNRRADDFLIGFYLGPTALGYYSIAYRILMMMTNIITLPFNSVAFSTFSRLQKSRAELKHFFHQVTRVVSYISFPAFIGVAAVAPELIRVLVGAKWMPSAPILQVLMLIGILHSIGFMNGALRRAVGKASWNMWVTMIGAITNVIVFYIAVKYGTLWVAVSYVVSGYFWFPLNIYLVDKILNLKMIEYVRQFLAPLAGSLAMAAGIGLFKRACAPLMPTIPLFGISVVLGAIIYVATCYLLAGDEVRKIARFVMSLRKPERAK